MARQNRYPVDHACGAKWEGIMPYAVRLSIDSGLSGPRVTEYVVYDDSPMSAIAQVNSRRGDLWVAAIEVKVDWMTMGEVQLCPICGERFTTGCEGDEPYTSWARCDNPGCRGRGYTIAVCNTKAAEYYDDEAYPAVHQVTNICSTCGHHDIMNISLSSPMCLNPACPDCSEEHLAELDEDDFQLWGVDPASEGVEFCECGSAKRINKPCNTCKED